MAVIHAEQFLEQIQSSYQFTDLEMKRLKYTLKAVSSEQDIDAFCFIF